MGPRASWTLKSRTMPGIDYSAAFDTVATAYVHHSRYSTKTESFVTRAFHLAAERGGRET